MLWLFIFGLSTSTWALKNESSFQCHDNQWLCGTQCIHQRSFCTLSGTCHPDFPRPCGDGQRCYHRLDNCWNAACHNSNCERDANLDGLDKNQVINTGNPPKSLPSWLGHRIEKGGTYVMHLAFYNEVSNRK